MASPPAVTSKTKNKRVAVTHPDFYVSNYFFEKFRPCVTYIHACHRLSINFVYVSHLFSREKGDVTLFSRKFPGHVLCLYACYRLRVFFSFDYFDYGFSPKMIITTLQSSKLLLLLLLLRGGGGTEAILLFPIHL